METFDDEIDEALSVEPVVDGVDAPKERPWENPTPEYLAVKAQWDAGEIGEDELPDGAVWFDQRGYKYIYGEFVPKTGKDVDRGIKRNPEQLGSVISPNWKPTPSKPIPTVRCTTIKRDGERCNRWSIRGATVCLKHGGNLPGIKAHAAAAVEQARMRLIGLADDAVGVLETLALDGQAEAIRLKAATEILDRAGVKGGIDINVEVEHKINPSQSIAEKLQEIMDRNAGLEEIESEEIIDAEEVESDD